MTKPRPSYHEIIWDPVMLNQVPQIPRIPLQAEQKRKDSNK